MAPWAWIGRSLSARSAKARSDDTARSRGSPADDDTHGAFASRTAQAVLHNLLCFAFESDRDGRGRKLVSLTLDGPLPGNPSVQLTF